jgi:hypothetical protein
MANKPLLLQNIEKKLGRPLRILHIGNIANNAYNNAKIMRRIGIEADVLCMDYYHIMGCPEWEDAELESFPEDENRPIWAKVDLKGFKRPSWFYQGPRKILFKILYYESKNYKIKPIIYKWICHRIVYHQERDFIFHFYKITLKIFNWILLLPSNLKSRLMNTFSYLVWLPFNLKDTQSQVLRAKGFKFIPPIVGNFLVKFINCLPFNLIIGKIKRLRFKIPFIILKKISTHIDTKKANVFIKKAKNIIKKLFPRKIFYISSLPSSNLESQQMKWIEIFKNYDIIQGYAIDGIYPLEANFPNWCAYEHGTIRDIPFENTFLGNQCKKVYENAPIVFVTNSDCIVAAEKLKLKKDRIYNLPHAFDNKKVKNFYENWSSKVHPFNIPTFLAPARHHWKEGFDTWLKGNDKIIYAIAKLKELDLPFQVFFINWGLEVDKSKELISELNLEDRITWLAPLTKFQLWKMYLRVDVVLDQFIVPALGGVCFEALAFGKPLITRIDEVTLENFFGKTPPVINAHDSQTIYDALKPILTDRKYYEHLSDEGCQWIEKYHSSQRILDIQLEAYSRFYDSENQTYPTYASQSI